MITGTPSLLCFALKPVIRHEEIITISTSKRETLVDITSQVKQVVKESGINDGLVSVYAQGATAAIMIQENWDESVQTGVVNLLV